MAIGIRGLGLSRIMFAISGIFTIFSIVLIYQYVSTSDDRALKNFDTAKVLVATGLIPQGTSLADAQSFKLLEVRSYPVDSIPTNSLQEILPNNRALVAQANIPAGQILVSELFNVRVIPKIDLGIPAGTVAVTIELNYAARVASFIKPGVNVAVYSTKVSNSASSTSMLFSSVRVLAVGTQIAVNDPASVGDVANFITLAVPFDRAPQLVDSIEGGKLYLALLNNSSAIRAQSSFSEVTP